MEDKCRNCLKFGPNEMNCSMANKYWVTIQTLCMLDIPEYDKENFNIEVSCKQFLPKQNVNPVQISCDSCGHYEHLNEEYRLNYENYKINNYCRKCGRKLKEGGTENGNQ